jgi:tetratricopeptide (TPR) repeat protein
MRKPQNTTLPSAQFKSSFNSLDESTIVEWLSQYGKNALYILCALIALSLLIYRFSAGYTAHSEKEYLAAANNFATLERGSTEKREVALKELTLQLDSMPELQAAYGAPIGQTLLSRGQTEQAAPFINATLKRTRTDDLPYYRDFGATSLLIAQGKYQEALNSATALQDRMTTDIEKSAGTRPQHFGDSLFALNMLRVALLHQELNQGQDELTTWKQWQQYAGLTTTRPESVITPQAFHSLIQQLAIGNMSLLDYIHYREKILEKS